MQNDCQEDNVPRIIGEGHRLRRPRCFHIWCLPLIWALAVSILYSLLWNKGEAGMAAMFAGLAGLWAPGLVHAEGIAFVIVQLIAGALVMAFVGFLQDCTSRALVGLPPLRRGTAAALCHQWLTQPEPTRTGNHQCGIRSLAVLLDAHLLAQASCVVGGSYVSCVHRARMTGLHFVVYFLLPIGALVAVVLVMTIPPRTHSSAVSAGVSGGVVRGRTRTAGVSCRRSDGRTHPFHPRGRF